MTTVRNYPEADHPLRVAARAGRGPRAELRRLRRRRASGRSRGAPTASSASSRSGSRCSPCSPGCSRGSPSSLALRPVEAIRREVEAIGGEDLHRRVPDPPVADEIGRLARHDERDARPARGGHRPPTPIRRRREPRAAQPAHRHPHRARGGPRVSRSASTGRPSSQEILDDTIRLQRLVDDLLAARRRGRSRRATTRREPVDLDEIVLAEARRARNRDRRDDRDRGRSPGAQVDGDAEQLGRVVRNLLDNATRYAESARHRHARRVGRRPRCSPSPTTARACPTTSGSGSSSGSPATTRAGAGAPAAPASASRSAARSSPRTAGRSRWIRARGAVHGPLAGLRRRSAEPRFSGASARVASSSGPCSNEAWLAGTPPPPG